ncbi:hypothetical protein D3C87_2046840 [compost metagenome]
MGNLFIAKGARNSFSFPSSINNCPHGFASSVAILDTVLLVESAIEIGRPVSLIIFDRNLVAYSYTSKKRSMPVRSI